MRRRVLRTALVATAFWLSACGGKSPPGDEGAPPATSEEEAAAEDEAAPPVADAGAKAAPPAAPLSPEEDSAREARAFRRRIQNMESYESCMEKAKALEEPVRTTIRQACARSHPEAAP